MSLTSTVTESFERSFALYRDLVALLDADALASRLGAIRSNAIGAQLWCVVGSRESYARAIAAGAWTGFASSLDDTADPAEVTAALDRSADAVRAVLAGADGSDDARNRLLLDLLEHEAQHHGQLIRYLYGLGLVIPPSWKARYALD